MTAIPVSGMAVLERAWAVPAGDERLRTVEGLAAEEAQQPLAEAEEALAAAGEAP